LGANAGLHDRYKRLAREAEAPEGLQSVVSKDECREPPPEVIAEFDAAYDA
jgi:hypothetical protein